MSAVYNLYQNCIKGDYKGLFLDALFKNEIDKHMSLSMQEKVVKDVYIKIMRPYGWDPRVARVPLPLT